jgi:hypothetical protein
VPVIPPRVCWAIARGPEETSSEDRESRTKRRIVLDINDLVRVCTRNSAKENHTKYS